MLHTQSDERLVALARRGKEPAFDEIVRRYRPGLVAFAAAYRPPDPEDVVQESLVRAWTALRDSTGEMHLKAWLYTIVRNRALNARRDTRVHEELPAEIDGVRQPSEIVLTNEELDRVVGVVAALPDAQREALVRSALEGHTHEQIAASLGSTEGAVRQLIYRARVAVRHGVGFVLPLPLVALLVEAGAGSRRRRGGRSGRRRRGRRGWRRLAGDQGRRGRRGRRGRDRLRGGDRAVPRLEGRRAPIGSEPPGPRGEDESTRGGAGRLVVRLRGHG